MNKNLLLRIVSAAILIPLLLWILLRAPYDVFRLFVDFLLACCAWEFARMLRMPVKLAGVYAFAFFVLTHFYSALVHTEMLWVITAVFWIAAAAIVFKYPNIPHISRLTRPGFAAGLGVLWLLPVGVGLNEIYSHAFGGWWILYAMLVIWAVDTGAFFGGKVIGGRKLIPSVSPGKTVSGFWCGSVAGILATLFIAGTLVESPFRSSFILASLVVVFISVLGDLFESVIKRLAGVKDSGNLIPGHGGILDRMDSQLAAIPFYAWVILGVGL